MNERYDIAIIGTGPAGLEAALNGVIRNKKIIIFGRESLSEKIEKAPKINNYLGLPGATGASMQKAFKDHIDSMGIKITEEKVLNVYAMGEYFAIMAKDKEVDKQYEASTVIIASGINYTRSIEGEEEFIGRGVGYCATCDAPLYKGKIVTIVGYSKESIEEANYISELASKVYFVPMLKEEYTLNDNIEVVKDMPVKIEGGMKAEKLILKEREIESDGIFILKDSSSPSQLVPGIEIEDDHIKVNRKMETSINGCFAAGDCTGKPYQYIKAAGEGLVAAQSAVEYLAKMK